MPDGSAEPVANRLRKLRERSGLSMQVLALAAGFKGASGYQRYENPDLYTKRYLPLDLTERLATALSERGMPPISRHEVLALAGRSMPDGVNAGGGDVNEVRQAPGAARFAPMGPHHQLDEIPIRSAARGGDEQEMFVGDVVGWTKRPASLAGVKDAYSVYMVGDSMRPRYEHGWLLHVNPSKPAKNGRSVVVYLRNNVVLVKLLAGRKGGKVELQSVNSEYAPRQIPEHDIKEMHVIVGSDEEG